ncbi:uncharacterized protein C5orf34 homolog [Arapaima gigas]
MADVSLMVLFEDQSVEVSYADGSLLQLSPCGSEFVLERRAPPSAHPLEPGTRVRQRNRFATSAYRELIVQALEFRNRFATSPYLPKELIPKHCRKYSFIDISEVQWPSASTSSSCSTDFGPDGELNICSLDGNARLLLSSSGDEFSVEFLCRASQNESQNAVLNDPEWSQAAQGVRSTAKDRKELQKMWKATTATARITNTSSTRVAQQGLAISGLDDHWKQTCVQLLVTPPKEEPLYTWVVQSHSSSFPPPLWCYPLSLALSHRCALQGGSLDQTQNEKGLSLAATAAQGKIFRLPRALPLKCSKPHLHRWRFRDSPHQGEPEYEWYSQLPRVVWSKGVLYRVRSLLVTMVEVFPGDGSVIRSSSTVPDCFTHYIISPTGQHKEKTYLLSYLPPDVPGQLYSISSVVTQAARILKCYNQSKHALRLSSSCCGEMKGSLNTDSLVVIQDTQIPGVGHLKAFSDGSVTVSFTDKVTLQMRWNFNTSTMAQVTDGTVQDSERVHVPCGWCWITSSNGHRQLLQLWAAGPYQRHVQAAEQLCCWIEHTMQNDMSQASVPEQSWSVDAELEKIRRFNCLLEHSGLLRPCTVRREGEEPIPDSSPAMTSADINEKSLAENLQKTSNIIQSIEAHLSKRASSHSGV